jgi:hypothetical protein
MLVHAFGRDDHGWVVLEFGSVNVDLGAGDVQ